MAISVDEWMSELERLDSEKFGGPDGFTVEEAVAMFKHSERWVRERLRSWINAGFVKHVGHRRDINVAGRAKVVPVYQVVRKAR